VTYKLTWKGDQVVEKVLSQQEKAMGEVGLRVESEAKQELRPGHGVETGTLRRSLHTAKPGYSWQGDDVAPSAGSPERGGKLVEAARKAKRLVVQVGSGLHYAIWVHQGHQGFSGYHYLTNAVEKVRGKVGSIVEKYKV
jgi:hypothetical protein